MPDTTYNLNGGFKPTIKRNADLDGPDFFPTPRWATHALIDNEKFLAISGSAPAAMAQCPLSLNSAEAASEAATSTIAVTLYIFRRYWRPWNGPHRRVV